MANNILKIPKVMLINCSLKENNKFENCVEDGVANIKKNSMIIGSPLHMFMDDEVYEKYKTTGYVLSNMIDRNLHFTIKHGIVSFCDEYYIIKQDGIEFYIYLQKSGFYLEHNEGVVEFLKETYAKTLPRSNLFD